jgi:hypothetical protein
MYILHGTWIPKEDADFIQSGRFCVWVETVKRDRQSLKVSTLPAPELAELLATELGIGRDPQLVGRLLETRYFLLPEADGRLLPSPELARTADLVVTEPEEPLTLCSQAVSCYPLRNVLAELKELFFLCEYRLADVRAGMDLKFWYRSSRVLVRVLRKDQYIPALKYRPLATPKRGRRKAMESFEIHPGWEIVSADYENAIRQTKELMPGLCRAGAEQPHDGTSLYESEGLLRHFGECVLDQQITRTILPTGFANRLRNTLLYDCLHPPKTGLGDGNPEALTRYRQWQRWRQALLHGADSTGFQLCLQLLEAASETEPWHLQFQAAAHSDPSLRLTLTDYWHDAASRELARRHFGTDFERQLLLQLGYAARMYPRLWDGLDSDRPEGVPLSLEEAFDFLKEHAWVLQDAGFRVLVPAWWTPEGRNRAKLRLRASGGTKATPPAGQGYFSLDALIRYRYELAIGGEPVSPQEWQQLVEAKTPLVRFRGQWLELDRDKMQRLLAFWQQHGHDDAEITLGELMKKAAQGEDEVDVSRDPALAAMLEALHNPSQLEPVDDPPGLHGELRGYQKRGVAWLGFLETLGLGGCLADDMGLGKTVQVIARLVQEGAAQGPTLLIAPTSVLGLSITAAIGWATPRPLRRPVGNRTW